MVISTLLPHPSGGSTPLEELNGILTAYPDLDGDGTTDTLMYDKVLDSVDGDLTLEKTNGTTVTAKWVALMDPKDFGDDAYLHYYFLVKLADGIVYYGVPNDPDWIELCNIDTKAPVNIRLTHSSLFTSVIGGFGIADIASDSALEAYIANEDSDENGVADVTEYTVTDTGDGMFYKAVKLSNAVYANGRYEYIKYGNTHSVIKKVFVNTVLVKIYYQFKEHGKFYFAYNMNPNE